MGKIKLEALHMDRPHLGTATLVLPQLSVLQSKFCLIKLDLTLRPRVVSAKKQKHSISYYIFVKKKQKILDLYDFSQQKSIELMLPCVTPNINALCQQAECICCQLRQFVLLVTYPGGIALWWRCVARFQGAALKRCIFYRSWRRHCSFFLGHGANNSPHLKHCWFTKTSPH